MLSPLGESLSFTRNAVKITKGKGGKRSKGKKKSPRSFPYGKIQGQSYCYDRGTTLLRARLRERSTARAFLRFFARARSFVLSLSLRTFTGTAITAPHDVTVAPGKAYTTRTVFSPQLTEGIHRISVTVLHRPTALCTHRTTDTGFRSNAFSVRTLFIVSNKFAFVKPFFEFICIFLFPKKS